MINRSHGGDVWQYLNSARYDIADFSVNLNPLGISEKTKKTIVSNIDKIGYYPDPESKYLKECLAGSYGLAGYNFLIGNGSMELIHLIPRALKAKAVLIPTPTFSEYEFAAKANNAACLFVKSTEKNNFKINILKMIRLLPKVDTVFICNPNNPAGSLLPPEEVLPLIKACKDSQVTLVIDEAFIDFIPRGNEITMIPESGKNKYLLILRSLTKFFVLPGLRIGYLAGHQDLIRKLSQHAYPWNVNALAQITAEKVIRDKKYIAQSRRVILQEREYIYDNLNNIKGIKVYPSQANFFLCKLENAGIKNVTNLSKKLISKGILIRNCRNFRGLNDSFFRIAVKRRIENIKLISALRSVLA